MWKQSTTWLVAAALLLTAGTSVTQAQGHATFTDAQGHYAEEEAVELVQMNLIDIGPEFRPHEQIDRALMKEWLQKALGQEMRDDNPEAAFITRTEVAVMLAGTLPPMNTGVIGDALPHPFNDTAELTDEQRTSLDLLYQLGIMVGDGYGHFMPKKVLTRGEAAQLLHNVMFRTQNVLPSQDFSQLPDGEKE